MPKRDGGLSAVRSLFLLDLRRLNLSLYKGKFKMLTLKTTMSQIRAGDWFVTVDLKDAYFHIQVVRRHRKFLRFAFGGKAYQHKVLPFGLGAEDVHKLHGSCSGPFEAPWHSFTQLPGWLAHSGPLQGVSELSQGCCPSPRSCSWPQNKHQEECSLPFLINCFWEFTWIPFKCRSVWLLPGFPASIHVWPASS